MSKKLVPKISLPNKKQNNKRNGRRRSQKNRQRPSGNAAGSFGVSANNKAGFVIRAMPFFGYRIRKKLPYFTHGTITTAASVDTIASYVFSANGLFDPDITGTGGQPMSFDQAMTFFNHYTVHNCKLRTTFFSNSTTKRTAVGVAVSGSSTVTSSLEQAMENGDFEFLILNPSSISGNSCTMSRSLNVGRFQSVANVMDDPNMRGDSASNPTEQAYFHLLVWNPSDSTTITADFDVYLEYDATFHEPRKGSLSSPQGPSFTLVDECASSTESKCTAL